MDDLLREFLTGTNESLDTVDNQLLKFEQEPNNSKILDNICSDVSGGCAGRSRPRTCAQNFTRRISPVGRSLK
jgi:two-component system, chemotaxis family, sensor kinase CheA